MNCWAKVKHDDQEEVFFCTKIVDLQLPCTHKEKMRCANESAIQKGLESFPMCKQLSFVPYSYPQCGHDIQALCHQWHEYMDDPSQVPKCQEKVAHFLPCSHYVQLYCYKKWEIDDQDVTIPCLEPVDVKLPRCGHMAKVNCCETETVVKWSGDPCTTGNVYEGTSYGPVDYFCNVGVKYIRICGHETKMQCHHAFECAPHIGNCDATVSINNPDCGHKALLSCTENQKLLFSKTSQQPTSPVDSVKEGTTNSVFGVSLQIKCQSKVLYQRKCGHNEIVLCWQARDELMKPCFQNVTIPHPVCGHATTVKCFNRQEIMEWKPWPVGVNYKTVLLNGIIQHPCPQLKTMPKHLETVFEPCRVEINVEKGCKHLIKKKCGAAFHKLQSENDEERCSVLVSAKLKCGHLKNVTCFDATHNFSGVVCNVDVTLKCWRSECKNVVLSKCFNVGRCVDCGQNSNWVCSKGHVIKDVPLCSKGYLTQCPECILEDIEERSTCFSQNIPLDLPAELQLYGKCICMEEKIDDLIEDVGIMVENFYLCMKDRNPLKRALVSPRYVPCFNYHDFEVKVPTLHGMQVYEWTVNNVKNLIKRAESKGKIQIFYGIAYCVQVLVNPQNVPVGKKKQEKVKVWCLDKLKAGFDCVQRQNNGMDEIVLFDPFAAIATHKLTLIPSQLESIINCNFVKKQQFARECIAFKFPAEARSDVADFKILPKRNLPKEYLSDWDEQSLGGFNEDIQKELSSKLRFCGAEQGLFDRINYLEQLSPEDALVNEISLLKVLELLKVDDVATASNEFKEYKRKVEQSKCLLHPLSILAEARLSHSQNKVKKEFCLLKDFLCFFPRAARTWFEKREFNILEGEIDEAQQKHNEWEEFKSKARIQSEAMDQLFDMDGLKNVKQFALKLFQSAVSDVEKANSQTLNFCFLGNASSEKTTVARLFAKILNDLTLRLKDTIVETSGLQLKTDGPGTFGCTAKSAIDGVLFIDDAPDLDPRNNPVGKAIFKELLTILNKKHGNHSIILAGYYDDMLRKLFSDSKGMRNLFEIVHFDDFDEREQDERDLDKTVKARKRQIPVDKSIVVQKDVVALVALEKMKKMEKIQQQIVDIRDAIQVAGSERSKHNLRHFVFRGSQGTGKKTVAQIMAEMLHNHGLIMRNHVEETSGRVLTGEHHGQTKKLVQEKLAVAKGGVLFINGAHEIGHFEYGDRVIAALVAAMNNPNFKTAIIIAGYPKDMDEMLVANAKLKNKFNNVFDFLDWDSEDCVNFLTSKASEDNFVLQDDAIMEIKQNIETMSKCSGWRNAHDVKAIWNSLQEQSANKHLKTLYLWEVKNVMNKMADSKKPGGSTVAHAKPHVKKKNTSQQQVNDNRHLEASAEQSPPGRSQSAMAAVVGDSEVLKGPKSENMRDKESASNKQHQKKKSTSQQQANDNKHFEASAEHSPPGRSESAMAAAVVGDSEVLKRPKSHKVAAKKKKSGKKKKGAW